MNDKLKPCPFCGGEAKVSKYEIITNMPTHSVHCADCYSRTWGMFDKEKQAIEAWNRRVNDERD